MWEIFYIVKPIIVIALIVISFGRNLKTTCFFKLDKNCTEQLKAIAIMLVVFGHLSADKIINAPYIIYVGSHGVTLFLFLSGYGLTKSYIKNGITNRSALKRFKRILIPYSMVTALWIFIDVFVYHKAYSIKTIALSLIGFDFNRSIDASMWYISFILLWYLFFNGIFKLPINNAFKLIMLFFVSYLFKYHPLEAYTHQVAYQWGLNAFTFPIGVFAGLYMNSINEKVKAKYVNIICFFLALTCLFVYINSFKYITLSNNRFTISNFSFAFLMIIIVGFINMKGYSSRILAFIGSISYEIYLLEAALMWKYMWIRNLQSYSVWLFLMVYLCSIITLSYALNKLMGIELKINYNLNY